MISEFHKNFETSVWKDTDMYIGMYIGPLGEGFGDKVRILIHMIFIIYYQLDRVRVQKRV